MYAPFGMPMFHGPYVKKLRAYPAVYYSNERLTAGIDQGGKILLPPSMLNELTQMEIAYPMLFELKNEKLQRRSHVGVLEFSAEEGRTYLPQWMMTNLGLAGGELVVVSNVSLPKGTFAKFQAQSTDFLDISNQRAVLEKTLRNFACLTEDDTISLRYNDRDYELKVIETKPKGAISIIECDLHVDFAAPVGYVEPQRVYTPQIPVMPPIPAFATPPTSMTDKDDTSSKGSTTRKQSFMPFGGSGSRIDGKAKGKGKLAADSSMVKNDSAVSISTMTSAQPEDDDDMPYIKGRLYFERMAGTAAPPQNPANMDTAETDEKPFEAFKGSGKKLR
eukprot:comp9974_c0_seq1/m.4862 comp9974_c0_seq1/g.4862  ORF comp9974_c0_seq1/g.4862 comp9974_c0_seq1/m.4862 type:complete len:333 (-) comp9974_c0_seq1:784-1782(-)